MTRTTALLMALLSALALGACEKSKEKATAAGALAAWKTAGFEISQLEDAEATAFGAKSCKSGKVSGLHLTLCEFADEKAASESKQKGLTAIGDQTGVALTKKRTLMVLADKDKIDPSGRTLNKLSKTFWELDEATVDSLFADYK